MLLFVFIVAAAICYFVFAAIAVNTYCINVFKLCTGRLSCFEQKI